MGRKRQLRRHVRRAGTRLAELESHGTNAASIHLTFDDGPNPRFTPEIARILHERGHGATFFFIGQSALLHRDIVREVEELGHSVGSHSSQHLPQWEYGIIEILRDYRLGHDQVETALGHRTRLFRPPYGHHDHRSGYFARSKQLHIIGWSCDPKDWEPGSESARLVETMTDEVLPRSIVLLHDAIYDNPKAADRSETVRATETFLDVIEEQGLRSEALR